MIDNGTVDLCKTDPGHEIDLLVRSSLRTMTAVWMGMSAIATGIAPGRIEIDGEPQIASKIDPWLGLSHFAPIPRNVA